MSVNYTGPWGSTDIPAGQRTTGWSNFQTGLAAYKPRFRDGDPMMAAEWRELYENVNYYYRRGRRHLWTDTYVGHQVTITDPEKTPLYEASDWDDPDAIVALTPGLSLTRNVDRGDDQPPLLYVKLRARREAGASSACRVRVYSAPTLETYTRGWAEYAVDAPAGSYCEFSPAETYPGSSGWLTELQITDVQYSVQTIQLPSAGTAQLPDVQLWITYLAIVALGDGAGGGNHVAAIQVREEQPA